MLTVHYVKLKPDCCQKIFWVILLQPRRRGISCSILGKVELANDDAEVDP